MSTLHTDVAIVGAGMAGATAAAMLGRAGISTLLVDPEPQARPDFRCEKLEPGQVARLEKTGLAEELRAHMTVSERLWIARYGVVVDKRPDTQIDARYEVMVQAMRDLVGGSASVKLGRVRGVELSAERQLLSLDDGSRISARLVVLATGLTRLPEKLGFERRVFHPKHSLTIGFDLVPRGRPFPFTALTWYPFRSPPRVAYLTLFPIGDITRANYFAYWDPKSPWLGRFREDPEQALVESLPGIERTLGDFSIVGKVRARWADLYDTPKPLRPGVVLIGDAFATSCPAAGTGLDKVFEDAGRLCTEHIPRWLASPGMGADKIRSFYEDEDKRACDAWCLERATTSRKVSVEMGPFWRARRLAAFAGQLGIGGLRRLGRGG